MLGFPRHYSSGLKLSGFCSAFGLLLYESFRLKVRQEELSPVLLVRFDLDCYLNSATVVRKGVSCP